MSMDETRKRALNRLHWDSKALLDSIADRLPADAVTRLRATSEAGDWTDLVDDMCAQLVEGHVEVTAAERDALAAVLEMFHRPKEPRYAYLNDPEGTLKALHVTD